MHPDILGVRPDSAPIAREQNQRLHRRPPPELEFHQSVTADAPPGGVDKIELPLP